MKDQPTLEANASLRAIFSTPVIECPLPNADALNAELKRVILEREKGDKGTQHSNLGGWQSRWDMAKWGGDAFDDDAVYSEAHLRDGAAQHAPRALPRPRRRVIQPHLSAPSRGDLT